MPQGKNGRLRYQLSYYNPEKKIWMKAGKFENLYKVATNLDISYESAKNIYKGKAKKLGKYFRVEFIPNNN